LGKEFFYFTSLLSYLACQRRIILQVTFAILLDGQLVGLELGDRELPRPRIDIAVFQGFDRPVDYSKVSGRGFIKHIY